MTAQRIRAVLFDADGVLQRPTATWRSDLEGLCGDPRRAEDFLSDIFAAERPCLTGADDFTRALGEVLRRWDVARSVDSALRIWTQIEVNAAMLDVVERVRAGGLRVALASNQQRFRADFMTSRLGYAERFDQLFYSCDVGCAKPDEEFFLHVLGRLGLSAVQVLFIDDNEANVEAARAIGMRAAVFSLEQGVGAAGRLLADLGVSTD